MIAALHPPAERLDRLVPRAPGRFDVVNDVDIDSYLKGVLAAEMFNKWHEEAFKAQAIVARHARIVWEQTESLETTARGEGGFGSTGR